MEPVTQAILCLAMNVYFEARSEDMLGQLAVAEVTLNRVESERYPDTICEVVWQPRQFSWTHDGKSDVPRDKEAWARAVEVAKIATETDDMSVVGSDVTHYHADYVRPFWASHYQQVAVVGRHVFYRKAGA